MSNYKRSVTRGKDTAAVMGPYCDAVATKGGRLLFLSGQCGFLPNTVQLVGPDIDTQARQVLRNIGAVLASEGLGFNNVVSCTVLLADIRDIQGLNAIYAEYFEHPYPARACYQVANLPAGARVEIVAVAEFPTSAKL